MGHFGGSTGSKQDQIDAIDHLMFNVHLLFDLNLVNNSRLWGGEGQKVSRVPRITHLCAFYFFICIVIIF